MPSRIFKPARSERGPADQCGERPLPRAVGERHCLSGPFHHSAFDEKETGLLLSENQRGTMIFHIEDDALRIVHIHVSNPWSMMPDKKRFPRSQGRSNYEYVQQVLSERTLSRYPDLSPRQKLILELLSQGKHIRPLPKRSPSRPAPSAIM